jgi:RHS repeat-associated protein
VKANYTYLSDGTKAAAYTSASAGKDYVSSFTYTRGSGGSKTLESVAFGGGRIRKSGSTYAVDYHITDHLGSVRAIVNASGTVVEQNDYYPFGMRHPNSLTQLSANRWRFSGKEEQDAAFGIAYSDFGARLYDRSAAWTAVDPLAEKYYSVSPYVYCNNNPIIQIDPSGKNPFILGGAVVTGIDAALIGLGVITSGVLLYKATDGKLRFRIWSPGYDWQGKQDRLSEDETRNLLLKHQKNMRDNLPDPNNPKFDKYSILLGVVSIIYDTQPPFVQDQIKNWISGKKDDAKTKDPEKEIKPSDNTNQESESDTVFNMFWYEQKSTNSDTF